MLCTCFAVSWTLLAVDLSNHDITISLRCADIVYSYSVPQGAEPPAHVSDVLLVHPFFCSLPRSASLHLVHPVVSVFHMYTWHLEVALCTGTYSYVCRFGFALLRKMIFTWSELVEKQYYE